MAILHRSLVAAFLAVLIALQYYSSHIQIVINNDVKKSVGEFAALLNDDFEHSNSALLDGQQRDQLLHINSTENEPEPYSEAPSSSIPQTVEWVENQTWFDEEAAKGCCPHAQQMYKLRYASIGHRCCTDRLDQLHPWQPIHGLDFSSFLPLLHNDTLILFSGDSLAEQHFLGLLCFAWSTNIQFDLQLLRGDPDANVRHYTWRATTSVPSKNVTLTLLYERFNFARTMRKIDYQQPDITILGGWHHEKTNRTILEDFFAQIVTLRSSSPKFFTETQPKHLEGPRLLNASSACTDTNNVAAPNINEDLRELVQRYKSQQHPFHLIRSQDLYEDRGQAHVGFLPPPRPGRKAPRDCLHWCVAPGVLEALARESLATLASNLYL